MRFLKISLITIGCLVALFIAAAVILPRIYKDDLLAIIREEANQNLTATLDFKDLDLSLFRQFPRLSVRLDSLSITGRDAFDGYTLLSCDRAEISVSIWDLFQQGAPLRIQTLDLDHPDFRILILENGQANYDITVPDTMQQEEPETPGLTGAIQAYSITDGSIRYEDRTMPLVFSLAGLQHNGKGDFTQSRFTLQTQTTAEAMDMDYDGTAYFTRVRTRMEADLEIDLDKMRFGFGNNHLTLNDLELIGEGAIEMPNEDILIDLALHTPQSDLKHVWSIIPGAFTADYQDLQSSGTFTLEAWMKGIYNETSFPSFAFHTLLQKGLVKYPSLSFPIQDIDAEIHLEQPGSSLDAISINIPNFQLSIKDQGIKGRFAATEIMTDPKVDAAVKGKIDLGLLKQAFPLEAATLSGQIAMDVGIKAQMSDLDAGRVDQVDLHGSASINNLTYKSEGQPAISVAQGNVIFSPQAVQATGFVIQAGKSDSGTGRPDRQYPRRNSSRTNTQGKHQTHQPPA
ncbi:MAG: AsmA family protein [Saprospiraceae bacterium]|nr:AsmA family protein [Saprospiraceae bacterium]